MNTNITQSQLMRAALALICKNYVVVPPSQDDPELREMDRDRGIEYILEILNTPARARHLKLKVIWEGFIRPVVGIGDPDQFAFAKWAAEWKRIIDDDSIDIEAFIDALEDRTPIRRPEIK